MRMLLCALASGALALLAAAPLAGCSFGECSFDVETFRDRSGLLQAGAPVSDTLTLAFITDTEPGLFASVAVGALEVDTEDPPLDGSVSVSYQADLIAVAPNRTGPPLASTAVGDTLYVYAEGALDPSVFACSPPDAFVEATVLHVSGPASVRHVRATTLSRWELDAGALAAIERSDSARRRARPLTA